jgi:biotin synthase
MQAMALYPANSMFVSDYLTTPGQKAEEDFRMIADLGFRITAGDYESAKLLELWKVPHAVSCGAASAGSSGSGGCGLEFPWQTAAGAEHS